MVTPDAVHPKVGLSAPLSATVTTGSGTRTLTDEMTLTITVSAMVMLGGVVSAVGGTGGVGWAQGGGGLGASRTPWHAAALACTHRLDGPALVLAGPDSPAQLAPLRVKPAAHDTPTVNVRLALICPRGSRALHVTVVLPSGNVALTPAL
jgi:hypothetical protein